MMRVKNKQRAAWAVCVLGGVLSFANGKVLGQPMSLTHCFGDCPRKVFAHPSGVAAFVFPEQLGQHVTDCNYEATLAAGRARVFLAVTGETVCSCGILLTWTPTP